MTEIWTAFVNRPYADFDRTIAFVDEAGFDGLFVADSQNIMPEAWVLLATAARLSARLKLGTFVTNPMTRHAAVTAAAAATLQEASGGRVILGVGRGDSSVAYLGYGPMKLGPFAAYLDRLQTYLRGEAVAFAAEDGEDAGSLAALDYGQVPKSSRIEWLPGTQPKVPLDIAATGPKVIALGATKADGVTFGLGVDPERLRWGLDEARRARMAAGLDDGGFTTSALVSVVVHPDRDTAREMAAGSAASIGRWQVMQGGARGNMDEAQYEALQRVQRAYDMTRHGATGSSHAEAASPELIDRFAIAGPPAYCIERLQALIQLGFARIVIPYRSRGTNVSDQELATRLLVEEVLPALRPAAALPAAHAKEAQNA
jgi:5,10-methylenetetrahydromethanopterin reductase